MSTEPEPANPPDPSCETIAGSLAALTLGETLAPAEQELVLEHLALCGQCRRMLDAYASVSALLPLAAPQVDPPAELRGRIIAAAERTPPGAAAPPPALPRSGQSWQRLWRPALGLALVALIALGVAQQLQIRSLEGRIAQQQAQTATNVGLLLAAFGNDDAIEARLTATGPAPEAWGRVFLSPGEPAAAFYGRGLPPLRPEQTYQLWIAHDGQSTSGGLFNANAEGRAWRPLRPAATFGGVERVFVTVEPVGGSPQPTGPEYLSGTPTS